MRLHPLSRLLSISAIFFFNQFQIAESQDLPGPLNPPYVVRSEYGPRVPPPGGTYFHRGIDYRALDPGNPILSVENGIVDGILTQGTSRQQVITIDNGNGRIFGYRHIFSNNVHPTRNTFFSQGLGGYFAYERTQIRDANGSEFEAIIFWNSLLDLNNNRADKILSEEPNIPGEAKIGGGWRTLTNTQGQPIFSTNNVIQGDIIGPTGTSGNVPPHLHLELNYEFGEQGDNPFRYVERPAPSDFVVNASHGSQSPFIRRAHQESEMLSARVNYATGLDLDEVKFFLFPKWFIDNFGANPDDLIYIIWELNNYPQAVPGQEHSAQFLYSGKESFLSPYPTDVNLINTTGTRIVPIENLPDNIDPFGMGMDDFYYENWNSKIDKTFSVEAAKDSDARYRDGYHYVYVVADNARSDLEGLNHPFRDYRQVVLDNYVPYVSRVRIYQGSCDLRFDTDPIAPVSLPLLPGTATVVVTFSETICDNVECEASFLPQAEFVDILGPVEGDFSFDEITNDTWTAEFEIPSGLTGEARLRISKLFDTAGNPQANSENSALEASFNPQTLQWTYDPGAQEFIVTFDSPLNLVLSQQTWARTFDSDRYEISRAIYATAEGGFITTGTRDDAGSFSDNNVWVVKLDSTGQIEWDKEFSSGQDTDDEGHSVIQTVDGGFLVLAAVRLFDEDLNMRFWLLKLDEQGNIEWEKIYGPWGMLPFPNTIQATSDGGYIVGGHAAYAFSEDSGTDALVMKLDNQGNIVWRNIYGWDVSTKQDEISSIRQTQDGGYIVGGYTSSVSGEGFNVWVFKLSSSGSLEWQNIYDDGDNEADWGTAVDQTPDGGFVVAGTWGQQTRIPIILKLSSSGTVVWKKSYNPAFYAFGSIRSMSDGNLMVAGSASCNPECTSAVMKLDSNGEIQWQKMYGFIGSAVMSFDQNELEEDSNFAVASATGADFFAFTLDVDGNSCAEIGDVGAVVSTPSIVQTSTGANSSGYSPDMPSLQLATTSLGPSSFDQCGGGCSGITSLIKRRITDSKNIKNVKDFLRSPYKKWPKRKSK